MNRISTLRLERCLLIPFRAKKDSFEKMDVVSKDVLFLKDVFFLERRPIKPPFVNFEKHARNARDPNERKTDEFYSAD
jgi:hypothetical protein